MWKNVSSLEKMGEGLIAQNLIDKQSISLCIMDEGD